MESGIIMLWYGSVLSIPAGYVLCDGNNGTPDLRDKFIIGAGNSYNPDDNGGSATHTHNFTSDNHNHEIPYGGNIAAGAGYSAISSDVAATGITDAGSSLPPYYALCYIMKT